MADNTPPDASASPSGSAAAPAGAAPLDVFISYSRINRPLAAQLAEALGAAGVTVWWDSALVGGSEFTAVIEGRLQAARTVVVLWSAESVRSAFVRDESSRALKAGKLVPVRIEAVELPLGFGQIHTLDLIDWDGDPQAAGLQRLVDELRQRRDQAGGARPAELARPRTAVPAWSRRRWVLGASAALSAAALGYGAKLAWDAQGDGGGGGGGGGTQDAERIERDKAENRFRAGLAQQYAAVPQLELARNDYLSALERRPGHGRARYYLAHVYAQSEQPADALEAFKLALLQTEAALDRSQRVEAEKQIALLGFASGETAPILPGARSAGEPVAVAAAPQAQPQTQPQPQAQPQMQPQAQPQPPPSPPHADAPARRTPPRVDPPTATVTRVGGLVDGMFAADKDTRVTSTTSLVLDPDALSDALPLAIGKARAALGDPLGRLTPAASSGVVNTLVLLQNALPASLRLQREGIEALLGAARPIGDYTRQQADKVAALLQQALRREPVAYIQIAAEAQRPLAQALALRFRGVGYDTPAIELVGSRSPDRTEVRLQGKSDRFHGRWIAKVVGDLSGAEPVVRTLRNARPGIDTYEVWIGREVCLPSGAASMPAACRGGGS